MWAENVRFEVVDVTGIVKYIRTKMFSSFLPFFSPKCFFGGKGGGYFSSHKDANHLVSIVNNELAKIVIWLKVNKLSLNLTKTNFMIFHPRQKKVNVNVPLTLENTVIKQVTETKFLGVLIDQHLSWKPHIDFVSKKKSRRMWELLRKPSFTYHPKLR